MEKFKNFLVDEMQREVELIKNIHSKFPADQLDFRPNEAMRSAKELCQYLEVCALPGLLRLTHPDNEKLERVREELQAEANKIPEEEFARAMDWQMEKVRFFADKLTEETWKTGSITIWKDQKLDTAQTLLTTGLKFLTAYRMQLFLYAKMAGNTDLNTFDCWVGNAPSQAQSNDSEEE